MEERTRLSANEEDQNVERGTGGYEEFPLNDPSFEATTRRFSHPDSTQRQSAGGELSHYSQRNILSPTPMESQMLVELQRERNLLRSMPMRRQLAGLDQSAPERVSGRQEFRQDCLPGLLAPFHSSGGSRDRQVPLPPDLRGEAYRRMLSSGLVGDQSEEMSASQRRLDILHELVQEEEAKLAKFERIAELQSLNQRLRDEVAARQPAVNAHSVLHHPSLAVGPRLHDRFSEGRVDIPNFLTSRGLSRNELGPSRLLAQHGSGVADPRGGVNQNVQGLQSLSHVSSVEPESLNSALSRTYHHHHQQQQSDSRQCGDMLAAGATTSAKGSRKRPQSSPDEAEAANRDNDATQEDKSPLLAPGEGLSLSSPGDVDALSEYQQVIRRSLELFEAQPTDIFSNTQGRKKNVESRQVGLRCSHCSHRPAHWRGRGAVYFPGSLGSVYQAAQNMTTNHLLVSCEDIPEERKKEIEQTHKKQERESKKRGGKKYWAEDCARFLTQVEGKSGLWFIRNQPQKRLKTADDGGS